MLVMNRWIHSLVLCLVICFFSGSNADGRNAWPQSDLSARPSGQLDNREQPTGLQEPEGIFAEPLSDLSDPLGEDSVSQQEDDEPTQPESKIPPGLDEYMGRRIARTMHYAGAEWLIRDEREREERCSLMLANLGVRPGMTICDMGCGNGFHSLPMAKIAGETGMVMGVDVQPEMLGFLRERMEDQGIENVIPILGSYHNPHLPPATVDLVLMVDVYHEFSHPEQMLAAIRKSLKPDGLVVLVEYREEDKNVPIKPLHKMSKAQVNKELEANGFKLVKEFDKLPWQHMMFFGKSDRPNLQEGSENGPTSESPTDSSAKSTSDSTSTDKSPESIDQTLPK